MNKKAGLTTNDLNYAAGHGDLSYYDDSVSKYIDAANQKYLGRKPGMIQLPIGVSVENDYVHDNTLNVYRNNVGHMSDGVGNMQGKLPWHVVKSGESPYVAEGLGSPRWSSHYNEEGMKQDTYYPSQEQISTPGYVERLRRSFNREKGKGIDKIVMPVPYKNQIN